MSESDSNIVTMNKQTKRTDSDKGGDIPYNQPLSEYGNDIQDVILFSEGSEQDFTSCSLFFMGSLKDACERAFSPDTIEEYIVYIYHDDSQLKQELDRTIFNSNTIIQYLSIDYIVCSYNMAFQVDRVALTKSWEDMFSTRFSDEFSTEECPLLIGIMRLCEYTTNGKIISEYQFKALIKGNISIRTKMQIDHENLLNELIHFKEECDNSEKNLTFNFVRKTHLSWEIILEIAKYLSINDIITTFSMDILPLLDHSSFKMKLLNPYDPLTKIILRKLKTEQISSLQISANRLQSKNHLTFLSNFEEIRSITLHNLAYSIEISEYIKYFPTLIRFCLSYDGKADCHEIIRQLKYFPQQIKQFEIHCVGTFFSQQKANDSRYQSNTRTSLEYFLLNIDWLTSVKTCVQDYKSWFGISISSFLKTMPEIRYFRIICNKYNVEYFLNSDQWKPSLHLCPTLKKIILEIAKNSYGNEQWLIKKALEIQTLLRNIIKRTIKFEFILI